MRLLMVVMVVVVMMVDGGGAEQLHIQTRTIRQQVTSHQNINESVHQVRNWDFLGLFYPLSVHVFLD